MSEHDRAARRGTAPETPGGDAAQGPQGAHGGGQGGAPPHGWYYFGPEPPWAAGASGGAPGAAGTGPHGAAPGRPDAADLMEAFDRMSRGDLSAATLGKLFDVGDRDFWKGALVGSAAALALSNLPALKALLAAATAGAAASAAPRPDAPGGDEDGDDGP